MMCPVLSQDLAVTAAFAFLWLVSSSAWAKGLTDVKGATSPDHLVDVCRETCKAGDFPSMGRLNASVVSPFTAETAPPAVHSKDQLSLLDQMTERFSRDLKVHWMTRWKVQLDDMVLWMSFADFWLSKLDPVGGKLLVHLQGNSFPQRPGAAGGCGGRSSSWALVLTLGS